MMMLQSILEERLRAAYPSGEWRVLDDSDAHRGHGGHRVGGSHFTIEIRSSELAELSRVEAHRVIYSLFLDLMPEPLHALRIVILK